jgi:hypothetical protein
MSTDFEVFEIPTLPVDPPLAALRLRDALEGELNDLPNPAARLASLKKKLRELWRSGSPKAQSATFSHLHDLILIHSTSVRSAEAYFATLPKSERFQRTVVQGSTTISEEIRQAGKIFEWWGVWPWEKFPLDGEHWSLNLLKTLCAFKHQNPSSKEEAWQLLNTAIQQRVKHRLGKLKERRSKSIHSHHLQ